MIIAWRDWEEWHNLVILGDDKVEDNEESNEGTWGKTSWESETQKNFVWESIYNSRQGRYDFWSGG